MLKLIGLGNTAFEHMVFNSSSVSARHTKNGGLKLSRASCFSPVHMLRARLPNVGVSEPAEPGGHAPVAQRSLVHR